MQTIQDYAGSITLGLILIILGLWYRSRKKDFSLFQELGIPGPEPSIIFGNYWEMAEKNPIVCISDWIQKYGKVFGYYLGKNPTLIVTDIELVKQILVKDFNNFTDRPQNFRSNNKRDEKQTFNSQLTSLRGKKWKEIRSIITPSFTTNKMKLMMPSMNSAVDTLLKILETKSKTDKPFDIYKLYQGLTMDVIGRTAFGIHTDVQNNPDNIILRACRVIFSGEFKNFFLGLLVSFPEFGSMWQKIARVRLFFKNRGRNPLADLSDHTKTILKLRRTENKEQRQDLLQLMMDAKIKESDLNAVSNEDLTVSDSVKEEKNNINVENSGNIKNYRQMEDFQIMDNSLLFLLAGYETTSTALAHVTHFLLKYPEVQEKIRSEIKDLIEREGKLSYASVMQMKYLDQVVMESLRLYPPIYLFVNREVNEDVQYGSIKLTKDMSVQIPVYHMNHDPDLWKDPEEFKPERFSPENKSNINSLAFQTFGAGPRNCVGMRFAQLEIKLAITKILEKYKMVPTEETELDTITFRVSGATMTPLNGINLKLIPL